SLPPQVTVGMPTGTRPRARTVSALTHETVAILVGFSSSTVSPYRCVIVAWKEPPESSSPAVPPALPEQEASAGSASTGRATRARRESVTTGPSGSGPPTIDGYASLTLFRDADGAQLPPGWGAPLRGPLRHEGPRRKRPISRSSHPGARLRISPARPCRAGGTRPADRQVSPRRPRRRRPRPRRPARARSRPGGPRGRSPRPPGTAR